MRRSTLLALPLALAGCGPGTIRDDAPVTVSIVGSAPAARDPDRRPLSAPDAALLAATAQGLVRFDGNGQVEAGLAIRWDVSDDGLFYTFRLADNSPIDAGRVARRLRAAIGRASRNPLAPILGGIHEVVAVTPEVIELRLAAPRPNLLQLLAQPELAIRTDGGGGPLRVVGRDGAVVHLAPRVGPGQTEAEVADRGAEVRLRGERAALAVARYAAGSAALVTGGGFADLALARAAAAARPGLRFDPALGLFGFQPAAAGAFLRVPGNRRALAMAIDRDRIVAAFGGAGLRPSTRLVPDGTELAFPAAPDWQALPPAARSAAAARTVAAWRGGGPAPRLRIAMPPGPGARLLFTLVAIDWRAIGVEAEQVPADAPADLVLVDRVAPGDVATWYLRRFACTRATICSAQADQLLEAARAAPVIAERIRLLAEADARLTSAVAFIPVATPLRWALVARDLDGWHDNPRAAHPLYHLRGPD